MVRFAGARAAAAAGHHGDRDNNERAMTLARLKGPSMNKKLFAVILALFAIGMYFGVMWRLGAS